MAQITRSDAEALIPEGELKEIIQGVVKQSSFLSLARRLPNMTSNVSKMKVLDSLPLAYFQTADTALKRTTEMAWKNKYIYAEEIAVIVPIAEAVLDDADYDIWGEVRPRIIEAFGKLIDQATILGVGKPANWREGLIYSLANAGKVLTPSSGEDLYTSVSNAMGEVEESGYNVTGILGGVGLKKAFRDLRDNNGNPIASNEISSLPRYFIENGAWDKTLASFIVGDFSQAVYAIRQDVTFKVLDQAVIQDPEDGHIVYNLAQQDMVALRCVMRLGWEIPNPITALNTGDTRFPFAASKGTGTIPTVNFKLKVLNGETAVAGAKVTLGGNTLTTGSDGIATFKAQSGVEYNYTVEYKGFKTVNGSVTASATTVNVGVTADPRASRGVNPADAD